MAAEIVSDALNEVAWRDDAGVSDAMVTKRYSVRPRIHVRIEVA